MELTIKELAAYLPYGLYIKSDNNHIFKLLGANTLQDIEILPIDEDWDSLHYNIYHKQKLQFKPILYPLGYLQDFLSQIYNELKFGSIIIKKMDFATIVKYQLMGETFTDIVYSQGSFNNCPMYVFERLVEMKLDVFNLIENKLAVAVKEDFNPYK